MVHRAFTTTPTLLWNRIAKKTEARGTVASWSSGTPMQPQNGTGGKTALIGNGAWIDYLATVGNLVNLTGLQNNNFAFLMPRNGVITSLKDEFLHDELLQLSSRPVGS